MLAADVCASSSSNPACCFCGVWAPGGPREWRSPCSGSHSFGMLICRNECFARAHIYALTGILTRARDLAGDRCAAFSILLVGNQIAESE